MNNDRDDYSPALYIGVLLGSVVVCGALILTPPNLVGTVEMGDRIAASPFVSESTATGRLMGLTILFLFIGTIALLAQASDSE